ncbi:MAG TPA: addiction module antidote protein [Caulobacteraceae bacterium]|jgi:probable addiction module antidote protein|nr:addiction module antidote protein [Caulobacteraceae bacterium]
MSLKTRPFDPAAYLDTDEAIAAYVDEAFQTDDPAFITHALGVAARARGMTQVAKDAGLSRESLYKALSETGNPEFSTVLRVAKALGLRLTTTSVE